MQLVGRKDEIKNLEWDLQKSEPQFIAIYGRRRIGKTYLVREMFNDSFTFSHTGLRGGDRKSQLAAFRASLVRYGDMKCPVLKDWMSAFDELNKLISGAPAGRKVIFIDELPWMDTPRSDLLVGLEFFWNARASARAEKDVFAADGKRRRAEDETGQDVQRYPLPALCRVGLNACEHE